MALGSVSKQVWHSRVHVSTKEPFVGSRQQEHNRVHSSNTTSSIQTRLRCYVLVVRVARLLQLMAGEAKPSMDGDFWCYFLTDIIISASTAAGDRKLPAWMSTEDTGPQSILSQGGHWIDV